MQWQPFHKRQSNASSEAAPREPAPLAGSRDGFHLLKTEFELPPDSLFLKADTKRRLTICNLFVNHQLSVSQIAQLLEEDLGNVVQALIQQRILHDRRAKETRRPLDLERRKHGLSRKDTPRPR